MDKIIFPVRMQSYDKTISAAMRKLKDRYQEDELIEQYKNDPKLNAYLERERPTAEFVTLNGYLRGLDRAFDDVINGSVSPDSYLDLGGIVLTKSDIEKLKASKNRR